MPKFSAIHLYAVWRRSKASHDQTRLSQHEAGESESVDIRWKSEIGDTLKSCPIQRAGGCGVPDVGVVEGSVLEVNPQPDNLFQGFFVFSWSRSMYLVCVPVATTGSSSRLSPSPLYIVTVVNPIFLPTRLVFASMVKTSPSFAVLTYVTCMSVLNPVCSSPVLAIAIPPAQSTSVAETDPWRVCLELIWFGPTGRRAIIEPFFADKILISVKKKL